MGGETLGGIAAMGRKREYSVLQDPVRAFLGGREREKEIARQGAMGGGKERSTSQIWLATSSSRLLGTRSRGAAPWRESRTRIS